MSPQPTNFHESLELEIVRSEHLRAGVTAWLVLGSGLLMSGAFLLEAIHAAAPVYERVILGLGATVIFLGHALGTRHWLKKVIDRQDFLPRWWRPVNLVVEQTLCMMLLIAISQIEGRLFALTGPATHIPTFFILLTAFGLELRTSLLAGAVAFGQYLILMFWWLPDVQAALPDSHLTETVALAIRGGLFLCAGIAVGLIALEIRRRAEAAFEGFAERQRIMELFGQQVSPEVVNKLLAQQSTMESESRSVCIMFLDIRDFTTFSESKTPAELVEFLNTLFDDLIDVVNSHNGIINKFLGDGFMAIFGAPLSDGQNSLNAVKAAQTVLAEVDRLIKDGHIPPVQVGIGLHAGNVVCGNIGSHKRREYTVIGDVVNTAARIESLNKEMKSQLLISESVYQAVSDLQDAEPLPPVQVKGRSGKVQVYRLA